MPVPVRLSVPADLVLLGAVRDVLATAFAQDDRVSAAWEDLGLAVDEVAFELASAAGVNRIDMTIDAADVVLEASGDDPEWQPTPITDRLVPGLASMEVDAAGGVLRVRLAPRST